MYFSDSNFFFFFLISMIIENACFCCVGVIFAMFEFEIVYCVLKWVFFFIIEE